MVPPNLGFSPSTFHLPSFSTHSIADVVNDLIRTCLRRLCICFVFFPSPTSFPFQDTIRFSILVPVRSAIQLMAHFFFASLF